MVNHPGVHRKLSITDILNLPIVYSNSEHVCLHLHTQRWSGCWAPPTAVCVCVFVYVCVCMCVCVCVCSAERHGLLHGLFQEWIPGGLQELLNEMEGSGQEWWEGRRGGRLLSTVGGLSGSHLQAWLNNRMLYENKNIICLLKGRERPSNWLPLSLCVAARRWEKKSSAMPRPATNWEKWSRTLSLPPLVLLSSAL